MLKKNSRLTYYSHGNKAQLKMINIKTQKSKTLNDKTLGLQIILAIIKVLSI